MRVGRFTIPLVLVAMLAIFCTCGPSKSPPADPPAPPADSVQANTPQLIATAVAGATPPEPAGKGMFEVTVDHALLFDPRTGPINAEFSDEPGVHLLVAGKIVNRSGRLIHRAAAYATLLVEFGERTEVERHSGGLGFSPRVNSIDPWRPDTERRFVCITRPLDPIYLEMTPTKLQTAITVQARDPLQFRFREEVAKADVAWDAIFGVTLTGTATVTVDGPCRCAPVVRKCEQKRGDPVKLLYQRGLAFKVRTEDRCLLWLSYDRLQLHNDLTTHDTSWSRTSFPIEIDLDEATKLRVTRVAEFDHHEGIDSDEKVYRLEMEIVNNGEKPRRSPAITSFILDTSAGGYLKPLNPRRGTAGIYQPGTIKPGETLAGALLFAHDEGGFPFELEVYPTNGTPLRVPLLPALLAAQNGGEPQPAQ